MAAPIAFSDGGGGSDVIVFVVVAVFEEMNEVDFRKEGGLLCDEERGRLEMTVGKTFAAAGFVRRRGRMLLLLGLLSDVEKA